MEGIDGKIRIRAREEGTWPTGALCDLSITSIQGVSSAIFLGEEHVRMLVARLEEQLPQEQWHLCCMCGSITPESLWTYWHANFDEATEEAQPWVPAREGEGDPMALCPVCRWYHRDTDDGSGYYEGSRTQMEWQRAEDLPDFADHWAYQLEEAAKEAVAPRK